MRIKTQRNIGVNKTKSDPTTFPRQRQKMCVETVMLDQAKWDEGHRGDNEESVISYSYRSLEVSNVAEKHAR